MPVTYGPILAAARARSTLERDVRVLRSVRILDCAPAEELEYLAAGLERRGYRKGEVIYQQDDAPGGLFILVSGAAKLVLLSSSDKQVVIGWVNPGPSCFFGIKSLAGERARTESAVALEPTELLVMTRMQLLAFFDRHAVAKDAFIEVITDRWRYTIEQLADFVFLDVPGRLAKALLQRTAYARRPSGALTPDFLEITQNDLGSYVGATREMVNKTLRSFAREGWIELHEGRVHVLMPDALRALFEQQNTSTARRSISG